MESQKISPFGLQVARGQLRRHVTFALSLLSALCAQGEAKQTWVIIIPAVWIILSILVSPASVQWTQKSTPLSIQRTHKEKFHHGVRTSVTGWLTAPSCPVNRETNRTPWSKVNNRYSTNESVSKYRLHSTELTFNFHIEKEMKLGILFLIHIFSISHTHIFYFLFTYFLFLFHIFSVSYTYIFYFLFTYFLFLIHIFSISYSHIFYFLFTHFLFLIHIFSISYTRIFYFLYTYFYFS